MDKVYVEVKIRLIIRKDSDIDVDNLIDEMEFEFTDTTTKAEIEDAEILYYNIMDVK